MVFIRAYGLQKEENTVSLFLVEDDQKGSSFLASTARGLANESGREDACDVVVSKLKDIVAGWSSCGQEYAACPRWGSALLSALCHIKKLKCVASEGHGGNDKDRILCISSSPDDSSHYLAFMNGVFAAQVRYFLCNIM